MPAAGEIFCAKLSSRRHYVAARDRGKYSAVVMYEHQAMAPGNENLAVISRGSDIADLKRALGSEKFPYVPAHFTL